MASHRNAPSRSSTPERRASADALPVEEGQPAKDKAGSPGSTPPRAGRTGNLGTRAERPAENRASKNNNVDAEPDRQRKAPSPAARDEQPEGAGPTQPPRDSGD